MSSAWSADGWYYRREEALLGPLSSQELRDLVAYGYLQPTDTVWQSWRRPRDWLLLPASIERALADCRRF